MIFLSAASKVKIVTATHMTWQAGLNECICMRTTRKGAPKRQVYPKQEKSRKEITSKNPQLIMLTWLLIYFFLLQEESYVCRSCFGLNLPDAGVADAWPNVLRWPTKMLCVCFCVCGGERPSKAALPCNRQTTPEVATISLVCERKSSTATRTVVRIDGSVKIVRPENKRFANREVDAWTISHLFPSLECLICKLVQLKILLFVRAEQPATPQTSDEIAFLRSYLCIAAHCGATNELTSIIFFFILHPRIYAFGSCICLFWSRRRKGQKRCFQN